MSDFKQRVELLPCPFCCNGAVIEIQHVPDTRIYGRKNPWAAHCIGCGATGLKSTDKNEAIARWNQRASLAEREAKLVEVLKDIWKMPLSSEVDKVLEQNQYFKERAIATLKSLGIEGEG